MIQEQSYEEKAICSTPIYANSFGKVTGDTRKRRIANKGNQHTKKKELLGQQGNLLLAVEAVEAVEAEEGEEEDEEEEAVPFPSGGDKKKKVEAPKGLQMAAPPQMPSASAPAYRSLGAIAAVATEVKQHEEDEQWDAAREMMALFAAQRQMQ